MKINFLKKILDLGTDVNQTLPERQRVRLANILTLSPVAIYLFFLVAGLIYKIEGLPVLLVFFTIINLSGLFFSWKKMVLLARSIPLICNSILIYLVSDIYDFGSQLPLFYFSLLAAYALYFDYQKEAYIIIPAFIITIITIILGLILPQHSLYKIETSPWLVNFLGVATRIFSLVLFLLFLFLLNRFNFQTESTLLKLFRESKQHVSEIQEARKKAELAMHAKSRFVSNMSHELRTPLNGIIGSVNLLLAQQNSPDQKEQLDVLKYSAEHMMNLVNDVLDFNKMDSGKIELDEKAVNIVHLVEEVGSFFRPQFEQKGVTFEVQTDSRLNKSFLLDESKLRQVLTNIIGNALKFTQHGKVAVTVADLQSNQAGVSVFFSVKDTGIGIPEEKQRKIFDSFERIDTGASRSFGGTGLGLSISKNIIGLMGGELRVKSTKNVGSQFSFILNFFPTRYQPVTIMSKKNEAAPGTLKGLKVLIAEDNPVNMMITRKFLKKWNAEITETINGKELVKHFVMGKFDVLLIDLEMPEMDGSEALSLIRKQDPKIPAIAFTAAAFENMYIELTEKGFNDYLQKPFKPDDLREKLAFFLPGIET